MKMRPKMLIMRDNPLGNSDLLSCIHHPHDIHKM